MPMVQRDTLTSLCSAKAAGDAYKMAGIGPADIDVADVHDAFTISEIIAYEDLGFAEPGEGPMLIDDKMTYIGGKTPVNIDRWIIIQRSPYGSNRGFTGKKHCPAAQRRSHRSSSRKCRNRAGT